MTSLTGEKFLKTIEIANKEYGATIVLENNGLNPDLPKLMQPSEGRPVSRFAESVGTFFAEKELLFYRQSDDAIVRIENGDSIGFKEMKPAEFTTFIEKYWNVGKNKIIIQKIKNEDGLEEDKRKIRFVLDTLSRSNADLCLSSSQFREKLPKIKYLFPVPFPIIKNGELTFPKVGYDPEFQSWLSPDAPRIRTDMTLDDAKKIINEVYKEFCFGYKQDHDNAIAGLITPLCRKLYSRETCRTPIFFFEANRERCGKDYCANIRIIVYDGVAMEEPPIAYKDGSDDEVRKKITSKFKAGKMFFHSSNNKGFIDSAIIESVSTNEIWTDRSLGKNENVAFPNVLEFSLSANTGIGYTPDFARRSIFSNLFLSMEDPNQRKFENPDLHLWVQNNRGEILSAIFTLIRNWYEKGMPSGSVPFASFSEWSRVVGGIMECAGYLNPCNPNVNPSEVGGDLETQDMKKMFSMAINRWEDQWITKREIVKEITNEDSEFGDLFSFLDWKNPKSGVSSFGKLVEKFVNRELSGITLQSDGNAVSSRRKYRFIKKDELKEKNWGGF